MRMRCVWPSDAEHKIPDFTKSGILDLAHGEATRAIILRALIRQGLPEPLEKADFIGENVAHANPAGPSA